MRRLLIVLLVLLLASAPSAIAQDAADTPAPPPTEAPTEAPGDGPAEPKTEPAGPPAPGEAPAPEPAGPPAPVEDPVPEPAGPPAPGDDTRLDNMTILGSEEDRARTPGSAFSVDEETLERYEYDDVNRVLRRVPGVYIREEDGFGLRPNIGLRGVNPERSSKVTLMQDGVLLAPAPYAAPAAYYFPLTTRMTKVEVFKGPSAIRYGPNTIGGAVNMVTRGVPREPGVKAGADFAVGQYRYRKGHVWVGGATKHFGVLVEGVHLGSEGFKDFDGNTDDTTGFTKSEMMLKLQAQTDPEDENLHRVRATVGYAEEDSDESYLGLSEGDFRSDPYRRYISSELDRMQWDWKQLRLDYELLLGDVFELNLTAYRHEFHRGWFKLNRFRDGPDLRQLLQNPGNSQNAVFFEVLTGRQDSSNANQALLVGLNDRRFVSQGLQLGSTAWIETGAVKQKIQFGARLHLDFVRRNHTEDPFLMQSGRLVREPGNGRVTNLRTDAEAMAWSFYVQDEITWGRLTLSPGLRLEFIENDFYNHVTRRRQEDHQAVILPGVGGYFEIFKGFGALAGIYRGFSPVAPGQNSSVDPEFSINTEFGLRFANELTKLEAIGFYNDYSNLTGNNTFSSGASDADIGTQFNAGEVEIFGLELLAAREVPTELGVNFQGLVSYTYTFGQFLENFVSTNPQFGTVRRGDRLPYVPEHQVHASIAVLNDHFEVGLSAFFQSRVFETTARSNPGDAEIVDEFLIFDLAAKWHVHEGHTIYLNVDNILDREYRVSRRPLGSRPGKPFLVSLGYKFRY